MVPAEPSRLGRWLRRAGVVALSTGGSVALLLAVATVPLSGLLIRPRLKRLAQLKSRHLRNLMTRIGIPFEDVTIGSFDGTRLHGWWFQAAERAATVTILHGVKKNRTDVIRTALVLYRAGFNVLVFDGRGHGNSEGRFVTYGYYEWRDVEAANEWLVAEKKVDRDRIALAGESMGAAIALQVAARNPRIRAVWADSPFASLRRVAGEFVQRVTGLPTAVVTPVLWTTMRVANYRGSFDMNTVDPLAMASTIRCPVFIAHGTADQLIAIEHSQNIYDALSGKKELWLIEGKRHARAARHAKHEYSDRLVRFFREHLEPVVSESQPAVEEGESLRSR
jgi:dipeptidyl aminopeptidase/acylaminoacyl peptidase